MKKLNRGDQIKVTTTGQYGRVYHYIDSDNVLILLDEASDTCILPENVLQTPTKIKITAHDVVFEDYQGQGGNAFSIMGRVISYAKRLEADKTALDKYKTDCMSADYDNLLLTSIKFLQQLGLK